MRARVMIMRTARRKWQRNNGGGTREERRGRSEEGMKMTGRPDRAVQLNRPWVVREGPRQVRQTSKRPEDSLPMAQDSRAWLKIASGSL